MKKINDLNTRRSNSEVADLETSQIYAPVADDLKKVEEAIKTVSHVDFSWLAQLLDHSLGVGGKRIRPALTLLSARFYNYRLEYLVHMATAVELMHTATLVHDDAIDKSTTRRGRTTIYKDWGTEAAVLLGDYLFARAGVEVSETLNIRAIRNFSQTLMTISCGELNQAKNSFNIHQTREDYIRRIYGKTASLFFLSTESGGILSEAPEPIIQSLKKYGHDLGLAFQIVDDILDFIGTEKELGKPAGSDLTQGTFTLPAMLLNERYPQDNPIKRLFLDRSKTENIQLAIQQVRNSDIVDECYRTAKAYCDSACLCLKDLPADPAQESLENLAEFVVKRRT
jgi:octaprenyl-diphosphate synthase